MSDEATTPYVALIRKNGEHDIAPMADADALPVASAVLGVFDNWARQQHHEIIESEPPVLAMYTYARDEAHVLDIVNKKRDEIGWYE